jgi:hypothetical protein
MQILWVSKFFNGIKFLFLYKWFLFSIYDILNKNTYDVNFN